MWPLNLVHYAQQKLFIIHFVRDFAGAGLGKSCFKRISLLINYYVNKILLEIPGTINWRCLHSQSNTAIFSFSFPSVMCLELTNRWLPNWHNGRQEKGSRVRTLRLYECIDTLCLVLFIAKILSSVIFIHLILQVCSTGVLINYAQRRLPVKWQWASSSCLKSPILPSLWYCLSPFK